MWGKGGEVQGRLSVCGEEVRSSRALKIYALGKRSRMSLEVDVWGRRLR